MKKAYVNVPDKESAASDYLIKIEYQNGEVFEKEITSYSYSSVFEVIKERHEDDHDQAVKSVNIEYVR